MPVFRPLIGTDKMEIVATARKLGTYDISSEPFHDCCPVFLPRSPELCARPEELEEAEGKLDIESLVTMGIRGATIERFAYTGGRVETSEPALVVPPDDDEVDEELLHARYTTSGTPRSATPTSLRLWRMGRRLTEPAPPAGSTGRRRIPVERTRWEVRPAQQLAPAGCSARPCEMGTRFGPTSRCS